MGRKSRGRGRDGPVWEVQYKQSLFLITPAHVHNWTHFDVLPEQPPRPPIPGSRATALSLLGKHVDTSLSPWWDHRDMERPRDNGNETKECEVVRG